jgi:hypothetical protein
MNFRRTRSFCVQTNLDFLDELLDSVDFVGRELSLSHQGQQNEQPSLLPLDHRQHFIHVRTLYRDEDP